MIAFEFDAAVIGGGLAGAAIGYGPARGGMPEDAGPHVPSSSPQATME